MYTYIGTNTGRYIVIIVVIHSLISDADSREREIFFYIYYIGILFFVHRSLTTVVVVNCTVKWARWTHRRAGTVERDLSWDNGRRHFFSIPPRLHLGRLSARYQRNNSTRLYCIGTDRKEIPIFPCTHIVYIFERGIPFQIPTYVYLYSILIRSFLRSFVAVSVEPSFSNLLKYILR